MEAYVFGDQSTQVDSRLEELLHVKSSSTLSTFLLEAFLAIRNEISHLPASDRRNVPQADTLGLLLDDIKKKGTRHPALESALLCIYEIGEYIRILENTELCQPTPNRVLVGLCTGSLAAAAVCCARTTKDVVIMGVQSVAIAFWVGMHASRRARTLITSSPENQKPWALVLTGLGESDATDLIKRFLDNKPLPHTTKPYISAVGANSVTVSGPPDVIEALKDYSALKRCVSLPIYAPYHAQHLYTESDVANILKSIAQKNQSSWERVSFLPMISATSGKVLSTATFGSLLHTLVEEILTTQVRLDSLIDGMSSYNTESSLRLVPIHTQITSSLASTLRHKGLDVESMRIPSPSSTNESPQAEFPSHDASKIAIIGFSGRFPEADGLDEFWSVLQQGLDVHKPVPTERFDAQAHYDPTLQTKNSSRILHGCWIRNPGLFDARFFHFSPREACQADPAQRLALMTAYEAIEMAGFVPDRTSSSQRHRVGVYYGTTSDDWREVNSGQNIDTYFIPGGNRAFVPGRINYFFKFSGPSVSVDTACSSSLAAINVACTALLNRECDTAVAGGTNIMTNPDNFAGLDRGHFLASSGNCKTFDDGADGYCRADGVGTVILKRLSDAIADNDPIYGVVLGTHTSHSAEAVSITRPLADAQEYLFRQLLTESGIHPHEVSYIEMHGTGTQAGDAVEMKSVLDTFAWDKSRPRDMPLHLGSVKSNVGHGESASGVTALIKVLLMMQKNKIPPHCGIKTKINHGFPTDMDERNVHIARAETSWTRPKDGKRRVFVNNFSAAGGNTAIMLEDAAEQLTLHETGTSHQDPRTHHLVTVSARSTKSLKKNLEALANYIGSETSRDVLSQIAYTTTARRIHHPRRVVVAGNDLQHIKKLLLESASLSEIKPCPAKVPVTGFLFTGQGAQQTAMAKGLYDHFASFRTDIEDFDTMGRSHGFPSFLPLVTGTEKIEALTPTIIQLGTVAIQIALARLWQNWGLVPQYVLGHSLGEFAALCIGGVLSISDTIYLAGARAQLLEGKCKVGSHSMLSVKASVSEIKAALNGPIEVACINGPQDTVLSGPNDDIDNAAKKLADNGLKAVKLVLPFAFHSSQMDSIVEDLQQIASQFTFNTPNIAVVSSLLGRVVQEPGVFGPQYLSRHCREPVNFLGAVESAQNSGLIDTKGLGIEIGAHPILGRMMKNVVGPEYRNCPSLRRNEETFKTLAESLSTLFLAGVPLNWEEYHRDFKTSHKVLSLPAYNWDYGNYWIEYKGNWCLNKGTLPASNAPVSTPVQTRLSSSVQNVVEEESDKSHTRLIIESDFHDPELIPVAFDHRVNGLILCPSSLYADIAYTLGDYIINKYDTEQGHSTDVAQMVVEKALIVKETGPQLFRASLQFNWSTRRGEIEIYSIDDSGKRTVTHARCTINLTHPEVWREGWRRQQYLIQRSIEQLKQAVHTGQSHQIRRGLAYKLFSSVVQYGPQYHGMEEIAFDSTGLEATAKVCLQPTKGQYLLNPFWCDSFGHLTGFIMNSNDSLDLSENVYVNHGWESMHCSERYSKDYTYQTYVKMQPVAENDSLFSGDVYVLRDNNIVAHYGAVTFQKVARRVLETLLPAPKSKKAITRPASITHSAPKPAPRAKAVKNTPEVSPVWQKALQVIADEIGVKPDQLTDDVELADMGVDSLMSLTVLGTFRETLNIDAPPSLFEDCPTVGSIREVLGFASPDTASDHSRTVSSSVSSECSTSCTTPAMGDTSCTTPMTMDGEDPAKNSPVDSTEATVAMIMAILAEEIGISTKELLKVDEIAEVGLDSLLSLTVLGRVREELSVELPADFFMQSSSVAAILSSLRAIFGVTKSSPKQPVADHPPATSILLQGSPSCAQTLFLFPDGSGSSSSYAMLPAISSDACVYGMNCPYMTNPKDLKCALQDLTPSYVTEIRRRQPKGPYNLAGWSAGGIAAYDAAQYLVQQGETVERLILLDSPNPIGLEKLPPRFYHFLENAGVFGIRGGQKPPEWLIQHFLSFIDALDQYKPIPFQPAWAIPKTTLIFARDGVCKASSVDRPEPGPDDTREMNWLLDDRKDLGPNGWDQLLGGSNIRIESLADANHFTMVREPAATGLAKVMRKAMSI